MIALPSLQAVARALLLIAAVGGWTWLAVGFGEDRGLRLRLQEAKNAEWCMSLLSEALDAGEHAGSLLSRRSLAQRWVLASRGVAVADGGGR